MKTIFSLITIFTISFNLSANEMAVPALTGRISLMDIASNLNTIYFTCAIEEEEKQIRFFTFENNVWSEILLPKDTKAGSFLDLKIHKNIPYILFSNNDGITLIKYENKTWHHVGKPNFSKDSGNLQYLNFIFKGDKPVIIFENGEENKINLVELEINGNLQIWMSPDAADAIPTGTEQPLLCLDNNETIYTAWFERAKDKVTISKLNDEETSFIDLSKGFPSKNVANLVGMRCIGNSLYLAYEDKTASYAISIQRYNFSSAKWEALTSPKSMEGTAFTMNDKGTVVMRNGAKKIVAFKFENNSWSEAEEINSASAASPRIAFNGEDTYIAFLNANANNKLTIIKR